MQKLNQIFSLALIAATILSSGRLAADEKAPHITASLQFLGDTYISKRVIKETRTSEKNPRVFRHVKKLLDSSLANIVNFEGVTTSANMPHELKSYLLKMPISVSNILATGGIQYAALANNHSMDFGETGLFESMGLLKKSSIETFGAGKNTSEAIQPVFIRNGKKLSCIIALNRTLPTSFWAKKSKAGSAFLDYPKTKQSIQKCSKLGYFTVAVFHWGTERIQVPKNYQIELARLAIDGGADAVIGHHPHILQSIEVYKGRPIFYSIGNFAFGSYTLKSAQEGMAVRISLPKLKQKPIYDLVPINVLNREMKFYPRLFKEGELTPLDQHIPNKYCKKNYSQNFAGTYFSCIF